MANPISNIPLKMPDTYKESLPVINDNFDKLINNISDLTPRTFSTANTGARPAGSGILIVETLAFDRPEYQNFATLTPQYDIYIDSGTNATGTLSINNTASGSNWVTTIGDYFILQPADDDNGYPDVPRIYIATSGGTVLAGGTGSVSIVAERCGDRYNVSTTSAFPGSLLAGGAYPYYTGYNNEFTNVQRTLIRPVGITPVVGGAGGGSFTTFTISTSGGAGVENDPDHLYPNGASLTTAMKNIKVDHHLNITTTFASGVGGFNIQTEEPYTANFATATLRVNNRDTNPHSIYVYVTGTIFSGITGDIFK